VTATSFGVIGSGWRCAFFLRLARAAPDRLRATGVVTRTAERGDEVTAAWGVPTFRTAAEVLETGPDYVITSVPWAVTPDSVRELVGLGARVLAETPPAPDLEGLRALWADVGESGRVQVAEQYLLMPGHAARLAAVREGLIGEPTSVQVSSTHLYHAVSMMRGLLGVGFTPVTVSARDFTAPLADPLGFGDWRNDATPKPAKTTIATLDFGDGRMGLYDFTDNQWWNPLRFRRIVVRGSAGEIADDRLIRLADPTTPVQSRFEYRRLGIDLNLEGNELAHVSLDGRVLYRFPFPGSRMSEDDVAVADLLVRTGAWARGEGPEPYPLADGLQDHLISVAIGESAATGREVTTARETWAR